MRRNANRMKTAHTCLSSLSKLTSLSLSLSLSVMSIFVQAPASAAPGDNRLPALEDELAGEKQMPSAAQMLSGDVNYSVLPTVLDTILPVNGGNKKVNMKLRGVPLPDAFRALAKQAGFNVVVDESVEGEVNVDLQNVSVQDALTSLKSYGNLAYSVDGKSLVVAKADSDRAKTFQRLFTRIIPLQHANAKIAAQMLNQMIFGQSPQQQQTAITTRNVSYDYHTNSLIVVGSQSDVDTVERHVQSLDTPRETRTWRLSHANAVSVASILSSSLFNEGIPSFTVGSGGSVSGGGIQSGGVQMLPSQLNIQQERIQEGSGASQAGSSSGGGGGSSSVSSNSITLRARIKEDQTAQISSQGPIIVPDSRLNTITLMGTTQQIAMAESIIPTLDRKVPQVVMEASIIELTERQLRDISHNFGGSSNGSFFGSNNAGTSSTPRSANTGVLTALNEVILGFSSNPIQTLPSGFNYQLNLLDRQDKLKLLANPTVITAHDNETIISIVDEVIRRSELTVNNLGDITASEAEIGDVGIVLNLLPKVGANGTISMRVKPTISSISERRLDSFGGQINLVTKRELLVQNVVLKDGESFILGGLLNNSEVKQQSKFPGLGDLPVLGQLARNTNNSKRKTELIIIITPHILNDETDMARETAQSQFVPVNLADPNKNQPDGDAFVPVSNTGYNVEQTPNRYLPPLAPARTLDPTSAGNAKSLERPFKPVRNTSYTGEAMLNMDTPGIKSTKH